jgi:hypothetical protein
MKIYNFHTRDGKDISLAFNSAIFMAVKMKHGLILDQEVMKNPYNQPVLTTVITKMHEKACQLKGQEPQFSEEEIKNSLDIDEMLYIYTMLCIERNKIISTSLKPEN